MIVLAALPWIVTDSYIRHLLVLGMLFAILASNWDLTIGYAGIFNFAHVAFFAVGAYTSAIAVKSGLPAWIGIFAASITAMVAASIAFIPAIRLRGVYVALTTFAFSELCRWLVLSQREVTGGTQGMVSIPSIELFDYSFARDGRLAYFYFAGALLVTSTVFIRWIVGSNLGRSLVAIRDSEHYAQSRGVNVPRQQLLAFILSAAFTGLVGGFYAHYIGAVSPDLFSFSYQALLLSMVWFGGVASIFGPILGALVLTFFSESLAAFGPWRFAMVSMLIILTMLFFPRGVWGALSGHLRFLRGSTATRPETPADGILGRTP